jgi:hypothetical protein
MAKYDLKFLDVSDDTKAVVYKPLFSNSIHIELEKNENRILIQLDKSTAIKFAKTLRTEINKITESEVNNG